MYVFIESSFLLNDFVYSGLVTKIGLNFSWYMSYDKYLKKKCPSKIPPRYFYQFMLHSQTLLASKQHFHEEIFEHECLKADLRDK